MNTLGSASIVISALVLSSAAYSQEPASLRRHSTFPWNAVMIGATSWASGGTGIAERGNPTAAFTNPAGIALQRSSFYVEVGKRVDTEDPRLSERRWDGQSVIPVFAAITRPLGPICISAGYVNHYSERSRWSLYPEGGYERRLDVHSFFGAVRYPANQQTSFGLALGLNWLRQTDQIWIERWGGSGLGIHFTIGSLFPLSERITGAVVLRYMGKIDYKMKLERVDPLVFMDISADQRGSNQQSIEQLTEIPMYVEFPWTLQLGMSYQPFDRLKLAASADLEQWPNSKDEVQLHLGASYRLLSALDLHLGFFTLDVPFGDTYYSYFDQRFLTAGITWRFLERFAVSGAVLDSHLFDQDERTSRENEFHQTEILAGFMFSF